MYEAIKNFPKQFEWQPNSEVKPPNFKKLIIVGMGGSGLAGGLLKIFRPDLDIIIHRDYGLPAISDEELKEHFIILNSYSGNTEEVLDAFKKAQEKKLSVAAVSTGGKLLELAKKYSAPFIQLPDAGLQPRMALGYQIKALFKIIGDENSLNEASELANSFNPPDFEKQGQNLSGKLKNFVPIIYSSSRNSSLARTWKVKFNETSKIPAFFNVFPELNHNEMAGFENLSKNFYFIFLKDNEDEPRILKRIEATEKLLNKKNLPVETIELEGKNIFHKIFSSLILADWTSYYLAKEYSVDPEQVPIVEEFKKLIQ